MFLLVSAALAAAAAVALEPRVSAPPGHPVLYKPNTNATVEVHIYELDTNLPSNADLMLCVRRGAAPHRKGRCAR